MNNLLLNKGTRAQVRVFINRPSHALLISGGAGSGKLTVAQRVAVELIGLKTTNQLRNYPYFTHLKRQAGKQDISIDSVRQLTKLLKLKTPGTNSIRRVIIIEDAQDLSEEAQNAMLKMLEEPALDCVFILTTTSSENLLPTIVSRAQTLGIQPVSLQSALQYFSNYAQKAITEAWNLSQGSAGLMEALLKDSQEHPLKKMVDEAKVFLNQDKFQRLLMSESLSKDKKQLELFLEALAKLLAALQHSLTSKDIRSQQKKILASRKLINNLRDALDANVSPKLITLELSLNLL